RKNYFYPDLPKGYQISQYQHPLVKGGYLDIPAALLSSEPEITNRKSQIANKSQSPDSKSQTRRVRIQRIHLEEDTGRLIHDPKTKTTLIDFNRAGIPLMELVTEPDLHSGEEVRQFGEELQKILRYLDASDADMEKGQMRVEVNISLSPTSSRAMGIKVELKNINSFKFAAEAANYEIKRQAEQLSRGEKVIQETRGWDETKGFTVSQRLKEESQDYRYFPEPDLPPLEIKPGWVEDLRSSLPELPQEKLRRFREEFGIDAKLASTIVGDRETAHFFEAAASELREWLKSRGQDANDPKPLRLAANYLTTDMARLLAENGTPIQESAVNPENFAELITYLVEDKISSRSAKIVLADMFTSGADPSIIIDGKKLWQISQADFLAEAVGKIIAAHPKAAEDYRSGKTTALQFMVGQVMKEAHGANPAMVRKLLEEKLK
ncbi:MAG: Asp-tRNA(Asn)/Glu-tRNA(Gln) amidotransferase subunit GatB, partial [Patescibacteria group bacterium]